MVPSNAVQQPGVGSVSADQFNTYLQGCLNYAQLRTFTGLTYMLAEVLGAVSPGDGGQGLYWYNANSTAADNNSTVIVPYGNVGQGAWLQLPAVLPPSVNSVRTITTGATDTALASDVIIIWKSSVASPKTEILPAPTTPGKQFTIKDGLGNSAQYPITVSATSGTFAGQTVINTPFAALTFTASDDGVTWDVTQAFLPSTYVVYDAAAYGAVGDGMTDNTAVLQAMLTAACATGGMIRFPPGIFKISATLTGTIGANLALNIVGSGQEVTQLLCTASNGIALAYANPYSSLNMRDMTLTTTTAGGHTGLLITLASGIVADSSGAYGPFNQFENISFRGSDISGAHVNYWNAAFVASGVSNINIIGGGVNSAATPATLGTGYNISGNSSVPFYAVVINFYGVSINTCNIGVLYGDWVQGMTMDATNFTGCASGVITVASPAGILDQLSMTNCQTNCSTIGVGVYSNTFNALTLTNNTIIVEINAIGVQVMGTNFIVNNNLLGAVSQTGTTAIKVAGTSGNGGLIATNSIANFGYGIHVVSTSASPLSIKWNMFVNDFGPGTDYLFDSGATGIVVSDDTPRVWANLPPAVAGLLYSRFIITDSNAITFNAHITGGGGGGGSDGIALCQGASGYYFR